MSDYIKREDAMKAIGNFLSKEDDYFVDMAKGTIKLIQSADVAPVRHGHWVESFKVNAPPTLRSRWICSWCGNVQTYGATDFCPNCGARMDEETEE